MPRQVGHVWNQLLWMLKRLPFHLANGGLPALFNAGVRWRRRRVLPASVMPDPGQPRRDPVGRPALVIVADLPLTFCLGFHPAAMLLAAADRSGRAVHFVDISQASGIAALGTLAKSAQGDEDVFVFAGEAASEVGTACKGSRLRLKFDCVGARPGLPLFERPAVYATTIVADAYAPSPQRPGEQGAKTILIPILEPLDAGRREALAAVQAEAEGMLVIAVAPFELPNLPETILSAKAERMEDMVEAIRQADIVVPDLAASDERVAQTLAGIATLLHRSLLMSRTSGWNDSPLLLERAGDAVPIAPAALDRYIAGHDALATPQIQAGPFAGSVSVIVLTHNNRSIIGRFLETLRLHGADFLAEVIVVDNASADGSADYVAAHFPWVTLLRNPQNGCSSGRNLGVAAASGRYIAFFDSDQWFVSGAGFEEALVLLEKHSNLGAIGWNAGWFDRTRTDLGGMISDYAPRRGMNAAARRDGYRTDIGFLGTSGLFMRRTQWQAIDGFDEYYDPTCFEDTDLSFQVKRAGFDLGFRDLTGIRHQPHQTTKADASSEFYMSLFKRNGDYFRRKWGTQVPFVDYDWSAE